MTRDEVTLDVVSNDDVGDSAAVTTPPDMDGPVFGVGGDVNLTCGGCGEWLVRGWDPHQKSVTSDRDQLYIQCPKCRSYNLLQVTG